MKCNAISTGMILNLHYMADTELLDKGQKKTNQNQEALADTRDAKVMEEPDGQALLKKYVFNLHLKNNKDYPHFDVLRELSLQTWSIKCTAAVLCFFSMCALKA